MFDWFSDFFVWMRDLSPVWAYLTLLVVAYGENVVPPIPGDVVVVFGGYLAGLGHLHLGIVVLLSTVGGALGFMTVFALGYRLGSVVLDAERYSWLPRDGVEKVSRWIHRYGFGVVAANRFLSGARSVISLTTGLVQMEPWRTAWWCTVSAFLWTGLISYAGYTVGDNWRLVVDYLETYGRIVLVLLAVLASAGALYWYFGEDDGSGKGGGPVPVSGASK